MYTRRIYSPWAMIVWTHHETIVFIILAAIPVVLYDVLGQTWLHLPWLPIALIGMAVAFILSFRNNATYGRIWEARKIWGGIVNTSRAWGIMVKDFITNDFTEDRAGDAELQDLKRKLILHHVAWLTALRHAMRAPRPWELFRARRSNRAWSDLMQVREHHHSLEDELEGYLSDEELAEALSKSNVAAQILARQSERLRRLRTRGLIDDFRHMKMEGVLVQLYDLQGRSERIKNFPYPRQYATLNAAFVWLFLLLVPFGVMNEFDKVGQEIAAQYPLAGRYFVWLSVPFSVIVMWVFHTMERIGIVGENPFEGSANDVPITTLSRAAEIDLREMLGEPAESIPPPIEPKHDTQT